jgi:FkbM family methyltransferase
MLFHELNKGWRNQMKWENICINILRKITSLIGNDLVPLKYTERGYRIDRIATFENLHNYGYTYTILDDAYSRQVYERVVSFLQAKNFIADKQKLAKNFITWRDLPYTTAKDCSFYVRAKAYFPQKDFESIFALDEYQYSDKVVVSEGDTVLDLGAYNGDTAIYFAGLTGNRGKVYSFEPNPKLYENLCKTIADFKQEHVIIPVQSGVSSVSRNAKFSAGQSGVLGKIDEKGDIDINLTTVDAFVDDNKIEKIDFIKMDIEGAEVDAIKGATQTIAKFRPKLAICIYHKAEHHWQVPQAILKICPDYRFYLRHHSIAESETVLYAMPHNTVSQLQEYSVNPLIESIEKLYAIQHEVLASANNRLYLKEISLPKNNLTWVPCGVNCNSIRAYISQDKKSFYEVSVLPESATVRIYLNPKSENEQAALEIISELIKTIPAFRVSSNKNTSAHYKVVLNKTFDSARVISSVLKTLISITLKKLVYSEIASAEFWME